MLSSIKSIFRIPELRRKVLVTFGMLVVYRIGFHIFLPGVNTEQILANARKGGGGALGDLLNFAGTITGGDLQQAKLFSLGIMPYISASIIFSLLVKVIPQFEALSKEGESGRQKINQYTRYATVILCAVQSMFVVTYLRQMNFVYPAHDHFFFYASTVVSLTAGTVFLMWLGEQITQFGIGNGISLIITAGIIARMPAQLIDFIQKQIFSNELARSEAFTGVIKLIMFGVIFVVVVVACVIMQEGQRRIPIQQQKHTRGRRVYGGQRHYLPLRVNSAGVMPVIFAQSLLILPAVVLSMVGLTAGGNIMSGDGFLGIILTIAMIYFFTYFWMSLQFNPVEIADNMKEYGSFIPGIRPGRNTADYLEGIMNRITMVGAAFLAAVTVLPTLVAGMIGIDSSMAYFLGGTGILIVVSVALDIVQKIESHLLMHHYEGFGKAGRKKKKGA